MHTQLPQNGLEMGVERVNNCLPDSPVQVCKMLLLPRGTKYNFALKVNSILFTEERNECLKGSFIRIPACCTSVGTQGSDHQGELPSPSQSLLSLSSRLHSQLRLRERSLSRDSEASSTEFKLKAILMTLGKSECLTHKMQVIFPRASWGFIILTNKCTKTEKKPPNNPCGREKAERPQQPKAAQEELP